MATTVVVSSDRHAAMVEGVGAMLAGRERAEEGGAAKEGAAAKAGPFKWNRERARSECSRQSWNKLA